MNLEALRFHLVEVFYKEKIITAFVREIKGKRLQILLPSGREELLNHSALVSVGQERVEKSDLDFLSKYLMEKHQRREKLKEEFDLKELWEILADELEEISSRELASLYLGREPDDDEVSALMRKVIEEKVYFSFEAPDLVGIRTSEEVKNLLQQREKEEERMRLLQEGEKIISSLILGREIELPPERKEWWYRNLKEYVLKGEASLAGKILKELTHRFNISEIPKLAELLVRNRIVEQDWFYELEREGFPVEFSEAEKREALEIFTQSIRLDQRVDLTYLEAFTIDAEDTEDFDDALSVEFKENSVILFVHIAGVSQYVSPGSALWQGALERASTLYLPEGIIPMLPFELSHGKFSLREGELRPALSYKFELDNTGKVWCHEIIPSVIRINKRYTYEEVDRGIAEGREWWKLYRVLMSHKEKRYKAGAFMVILPEIQLKVKPGGEIEIKRIEMTPARDLVAEAMIVCNYYGAKFLMERNIPAIYRSQREPYQIIPDREESIYHQILQLKFMAKSELSLEPALHTGLGLECYTTQTSPIRRFLDLLIQYQIEAYLTNKFYLPRETLQRLLPELQSNILRAQNLQNRRKRYFLLKYLERYQRERPLLGIVMEVQQSKAKVYLPEYNITGEIVSPPRDVLSPGIEVIVKLDRVNPFLEILRLRLA
ncbi:MAG: ribonuclease catalytic domain-containing protein [Caldimicrobium sp.]|nr:ribonuclease catalytic domain-containing protein [Caldimicrobium sp.]MCX7874174.1 ribonuclease catalytic domain-containing protein [Caldimicrobium sp.]MDW8094317.1 RNB domain-containing ribonuclease [Caldimicrobium sp.]